MKTNSSSNLDHFLSSSSQQSHHNSRNVFHMLTKREIAPRIKKYSPKKQGSGTSGIVHPSFVKPQSENARDSRRELLSWVEAESLRCLSAIYCPLTPSPRSTIAAAFSSDGKILASTHGDHTVKIIDCQTGKCLKVLSGHRRTPWVVRFHPLRPEILASGSLDHEVRLWNANTSECIVSRDFYRPIASIAFHAEGELLAVAAGHKLYLWRYSSSGETSAPAIVLRTRRSLRAVHFHPHSAPLLLTAEVNDLDPSDSTMALATAHGYLHYPPPALYMGNMHRVDRLNLAAELPLMPLPLFPSPPMTITDSRQQLQNGGTSLEPSVQHVFRANATEQYEQLMPSSIPMSNTHNTVNGSFANQNSASDMDISGAEDVHGTRLNQLGQDPLRDRIRWELPFMQGWLMGHRAGTPSSLPLRGSPHRYLVSSERGSTSLAPEPANTNREYPEVSLDMPFNMNPVEFYLQNGPTNEPNNMGDPIPMITQIQSHISATLTATAAAELPCTVKLRIWSHDQKNPCALLKVDRCRLTIPHAVLCSEMGAHFSPCGRYLAACVACVLPQLESDSGISTHFHQEAIGAGTSPTRHPISARQVVYELRVYSLEEETFGSVLAARPIRAAHCLTSIQFSPSSEHILLAYGRRHSSLLKSIDINGDNSLSIYTVLEVYRVSDMELVRVLPSAEDEVNVACFHPFSGGGIVYGTKEGKLRILQFNGTDGENFTRPDQFLDAQMVDVE
ncbi:transducin family protein / WD-40 repeat family protein [Artemisia annua]|uniref:Transducin family protein / WD-40 repeat family protein n=1 Tax=Artemisia annua TaxID=35608 RepID=A0A2U1LZ60_ARTAN|nr:transducin family protein / WD-40 repeat family protein [Artemisia annua]